MTISYSATQTLALDISRELVISLAPEEVDLFDEVASIYFSESSKFQRVDGKRESLLGFGGSETIIAITPAILAAVDAAINYIGYDLLKVGKDETIELIKSKVKNLFSRIEKKNDIEPLTNAQLEFIKSLAQKKAGEFGMKPEKAKHMAEALVGTLVLKVSK